MTGQVYVYCCAAVSAGTICNCPYQTTITVVNGEGQPIAVVPTDQLGKFQIGLRPGSYTLIPYLPYGGMYAYPSAGPVDVIITRNGFTSATIWYNVGIY